MAPSIFAFLSRFIFLADSTSTMGESYLCPVTPVVEEKSEELTKGVKKEDEARVLFEWVRDRFIWDMTKIRGAKYLLSRSPEYAMSFDKSNLLIALFRARGFEARFRFMRCTFHNEFRDEIDDSFHAPIQVKVDEEWVTADPAFGADTSEFKSVSSFGEETWESIKSEKKIDQLPRWFVYTYNYGARFLHPGVRSIKSQLRQAQGR